MQSQQNRAEDSEVLEERPRNRECLREAFIWGNRCCLEGMTMYHGKTKMANIPSL